MQKHRFVFIVLLALMAGQSLGKQAPTFDLNAEPSATAAAFLESDKLKAFAGVKKVAITNFRVEFAVSNTGKASSSFNGVTMTRSDITLTGVSDEVRRDIADQLYGKLVKDLTDAGLEVLPYETVKASTWYQKMAPILKDSQQPVGTQSGESVFIGPTGMPIYMTNDDRHLGVGAMFGGMSTIQPQNHEPRIAEELEAAVLRVTMAVNFAELQSKGGMFASQSSVTGRHGLVMLPDLTQALLVSPRGGRARIRLDTGIEMPSDALTVKETTSKGDKVAQGIGNALVMLAGAGAKQSMKKYEAAADPVGYANTIVSYGAAVEAALVSVVRGGFAP